MDFALLTYVVERAIRCCYVHPVRFVMVWDDLDIKGALEDWLDAHDNTRRRLRTSHGIPWFCRG